MKKLYTLSAILITFLSFAQVPQGISYQAIALDASGNPVVSANVGIRLSILDATATGAVLYSESHLKTTNPQGLFNLVIGQGTSLSGIFASIKWETNSKFLKVEMDATGGTSYVFVGTTQLLSAPYALAADSLVTSPGEGITLVSPNGTPYQVTVNDSGQLSLPTSVATSNYPNTFYLYGSFNSFNPSTAFLLPTQITFGTIKYGYKYFTSGTEFKIISTNNSSGSVYGFDESLQLTQNASAFTIPSNGFYYISISKGNQVGDLYYLQTSSISPSIVVFNLGTFNPTYNSTTNTFTFIINGVTSNNNSNFFYFNIPAPQTNEFGDNLADGTIDSNGTSITFPNTTTTPKNYRVDLVLNFNGSGNYTITQIP